MLPSTSGRFPIPPARDESWWARVAEESLKAFIAAVGAVVWPEVEAHLAESSWIHDHVDSAFPAHWHVDPHHLSPARARLSPQYLAEESVTLGSVRVSAWLDAQALRGRGQRTAVRQAAARKRRLYRRFLWWAHRRRLCGDVAEQVVAATLESLKGSHLWIPPSARPGEVRELLGRPVGTGGPLDAAGQWPRDPENLAAGATAFAVEVKNIRSTIYPWDHETWDLLAKLGEFPDVLPVLVARRVHPMTFRFFKDVGAIATQTGQQWFSPEINGEEFARVTRALGFSDAARVDPAAPSSALSKFFASTGPQLAADQLAKWQVAGPIVNGYGRLRDDRTDPRERARLWSQFAKEVVAVGLYQRGGWAPVSVEDEERPDEIDYDAYLQ